MGSPQELWLKDLELRPSSSGTESLRAILLLQDYGHSGQDYSQSRTTYILSVQVQPKELPLLSGLIGRSIWIQGPQLHEEDHLRIKEERDRLREAYLSLHFSLEDLLRTHTS
jgi:hypothetical protein